MQAGMSVGALFNHKLRLGFRGRRDIFRRLARAIPPGERIAWFHAASLGEFEQGRPVIEALQEKRPEMKILLTFFSPSGYEIRKDYKGADYIFYLPMDAPRNVRRFLDTVNPELAVFIKYEFWINYLLGLCKRGTRTYIISAIFRPGQSFFRPYGKLFRKALAAFTHIFVQDTLSMELLSQIGIHNVTVTGDTRFDRVYQIARGATPLPEVEKFTDGAKVLVAGSTWPPDEDLLIKLINSNKDIKFIIAPHEIDRSRIDKLVENIELPALKYTELTPQSDLHGAQVLFLDTIGMLSRAYRYGRWAYIGGGFGVGIHNTLEAATFGLPLAFGPNYEKFREARGLIEAGGARSVGSMEELEAWFYRMKNDKIAYEISRKASLEYVESHRGATSLILTEICKV